MGKKIKFYAIGDPHIAKRHLSLSEEAITGTLKMVNKNPNVDFVVIMGDILDTHNSIQLTQQRMAINWIMKLAEKVLTIVLIGNHDRPSNKDFFSDIHPFMGIDDIPKKLYIVNKPKAIHVSGKNVLFMPYVPPGHFIEGFDTCLKKMHEAGKWKGISSIKDFAMVFAHQEFKGAPYGPLTSVKGDDWPKDYPLVISGHIHSRMWLQENVFYTGSLYAITISETNDKGVIVGDYDIDTKKLEYRTTRVVMSQKNIMTIDANNESGVMEMLNLDRENTKYIIKGTSHEIAAIKNKVYGKKLNIAYDIRPSTPTTYNSTKSIDYDSILRSKPIDQDMKQLLEEIMA